MCTITVITSHLNDTFNLLRTFNNLNSLDPPPKWIIIDGKSNRLHKSKLGIIKNSYKGILLFKSEEDSGIYDAWNKSIEFLKYDEHVIFLGAGDTIEVEKWKQINSILRLNSYKFEIFCFNVRVIKHNKSKIWKSLFNLKKFEFGRPKLPPHQGVICSSKIIKNIRFDCSYKVAADSKFLLQALDAYAYECFDVIIANMDGNGISNNPKLQIRIQYEIQRINKELKIKVPKFHFIMNWINRYLNYTYYSILK
jgi:hypothetical protein